jgi:DNA-binding CsgD family transcriptional regulator
MRTVFGRGNYATNTKTAPIIGILMLSPLVLFVLAFIMISMGRDEIGGPLSGFSCLWFIGVYIIIATWSRWFNKTESSDDKNQTKENQMKSKKLSPIQGAGLGCFIGTLFSIFAIATIALLSAKRDPADVGSLTRLISFLPLVTAVVGFFWAQNAREKADIESKGTHAQEGKLLALLAEGHSIPQIAEKLGISEMDVSTIKTGLMQRLDAKDEIELVAKARQKGYWRSYLSPEEKSDN